MTIDEILEAAEKATPGPWMIAGGRYLLGGKGKDQQIAVFDNDDDWEEEQNANKCFIAGAPQLAAEVRRMRIREKVLTEALSSCAEIRRKVESIERGEEWTGGEPTLGTCRLLGDIKRASDQASAAIARKEKE